MLRLLFVGDVVGGPGCAAARALLPALRVELHVDAIIVNGENSAPQGFGITALETALLLESADLVTLGDHAFDRKDAEALLAAEPRIVRPANVGAERPGRGFAVIQAGGVRIGVVTVQGQVFMKPLPESPFAAVDRVLPQLREAGADVVLVEMHAEATSEKQGMGWHCAGRAAAVVGTHTHTGTADARVLPGGTAYVTDIGMTGAAAGIIGFERDGFLRFIATGDRTGMPPRPGAFPARLDAMLIEADPTTGRATLIERVARTYLGDAEEPSAGTR